MTSLRLQNTAGTGFSPIWAGTRATNVLIFGMVVGRANTTIPFSDNDFWRATSDTRYYAPGLRWADESRASLTFTFEGIGTWLVDDLKCLIIIVSYRYCSDRDMRNGFYTVLINGSGLPERLDGQVTQRMLWSNSGRPTGQHAFIPRQKDTGDTTITLRFFGVSSPVTQIFDTLAALPHFYVNQIAFCVTKVLRLFL